MRLIFGRQKMPMNPTPYRLACWGIAFFMLVGPLWAQSPSSTLGQGLDRYPSALFATDKVATPHQLVGHSGPSLPAAVDLSSHLPPVRSQGAIGSCAAWSTVYYARTLMEQSRRGWDAAREDHQFAPLFSYNQITQGRNEGTAITAHMRLLQDLGAVSLDAFPYVDRLDVQPSDDLKIRASDLKIEGFRSLPRRDGALDLDAVRAFLAEGRPVVAGFELFEDFQRYQGGVYQTTDGTLLGGHAMTIVGYDDQKGAFRLVNSWGTNWGEEGFLWLSYESARSMTKTNYGGAVMVDAVRPQTLAPPSDLVASKGSSTQTISLRWTGSTADRYLVWRADNETQQWALLATVVEDHYDDPLPPGVHFVYSVQAERGEGEKKLQSSRSELDEGWTQEEGAAPGRVQDLDFVRYLGGLVLVWSKLDTESYQVFRFQSDSDQFVLLGTSQDALYRDERPFEWGDQATYMVLAVNPFGQGLPSENLTVLKPASAGEPSSKLPDQLAQQTADDRRATPAAQTPYRGAFDESNWFDPRFVEREFAAFAEKERRAFAQWQADDAQAFRAFQERDRP